MSSGRSSEDREDDNDEVENAAALAAASMTSLIYQDLLTAMRDDASTSGSGRGGRHRHPHPGQQPMSLQGSRMGSYGRIDGSRKSALQNEIRSVKRGGQIHSDEFLTIRPTVALNVSHPSHSD